MYEIIIFALLLVIDLILSLCVACKEEIWGSLEFKDERINKDDNN